MQVETVKDELLKHLGKNATIKYNLGRNKVEEYQVKIKKLYNHVFLVETSNSQIKSFSYSDVIMKTIKINYYWILYICYYSVINIMGCKFTSFFDIIEKYFMKGK